MLYFLGLLLVAQSCLGESGHSSFFGARVGRGKRRGSQDESPGERNTAVVKSRSIGRTRLPPGVVIRPGKRYFWRNSKEFTPQTNKYMEQASAWA